MGRYDDLLDPILSVRDRYDEDDYDEMLDCDGAINVCGLTFNPSDILKQCDPTAYRCGFSDFQEEYDVYLCPICDTEHGEDEESAKYCCQSDDENDYDEDEDE